MKSLAIALCAPSGTGKTTIARELVARRDDLIFSVSATTRAARPDERAGIDYRFVDVETFEKMIQAGDLLEWARVHGEYYGTPLENLEIAGREGKNVILDIDVQGARQVAEVRPDTVTIFLLPPSAEALLERLRKRGSEDAEKMRRRLQTAKEELSTIDDFEYVLVNEHLDETVLAVAGIIDAERRKRSRCQAEFEALRLQILEDLESLEP